MKYERIKARGETTVHRIILANYTRGSLLIPFEPANTEGYQEETDEI